LLALAAVRVRASPQFAEKVDDLAVLDINLGDAYAAFFAPLIRMAASARISLLSGIGSNHRLH
jgi:hypothetical protein